MAQFGLTETDISNSSGAIRGYLFDQYARACGFKPSGGSWVLVVRTDGECEFSPLAPGERWCCEKARELAEPTTGDVVGLPPWSDENQTRRNRERSD